MAVGLYIWEGPFGKVICTLQQREYEKSLDILSPYGNGGFISLGNIDGFYDDWKNFLCDSGFVAAYIALNPLASESPSWPSHTLFQQNTAYFFDLTIGEDRLHRVVTAAQKQRPERWLKSGWQLNENQAMLRDRFLMLYPKFIEHVSAAPVYRFSTNVLNKLIDMRGAYLIGLEKDSEVISVHLYLSSPYAADWFLHASIPGVRADSRVILWRAMRRFAAKNVNWFWLGSGVSDGDSIARFKAGLGAQSRPLISLKQVVDKERYIHLCRRAGVSSKVDGYFPPYHAPGVSG